MSFSDSTRPDGRLVTTAAIVHRRLSTLRPKLAFDPALKKSAFPRWQQKVRLKLRELLGLPAKLPAMPRAKRLSDEPRDGYRLQRWEIYPEPGVALPLLVLVPESAVPGVVRSMKGSGSRFPLVMCFPGSEHPKERLAGEPTEYKGGERFLAREDMARQLVRRGFVAVAMDNLGTCELLDPRAKHWMRQSLHLMWMGTSYEGMAMLHRLQAMRFACALECVDAKRVAVCGHSLGAKPALMLGVLGPLYASQGVGVPRAVVWNDFLGPWRRQMTVRNVDAFAPWHIVPGMIGWMDYMDLHCAVAPTPLLVTEGGRSEDIELVRAAHRLAGSPRGFEISYMPNFRKASARKWDRKPVPDPMPEGEYGKYHNFDGDHYFKGDVAVPWLERVMKA